MIYGLVLGGDFAKTGSRHDQQDADEYALRMLDKAVEQLKRYIRSAVAKIVEIY